MLPFKLVTKRMKGYRTKTAYLCQAISLVKISDELAFTFISIIEVNHETTEKIITYEHEVLDALKKPE